MHSSPAAQGIVSLYSSSDRGTSWWGGGVMSLLCGGAGLKVSVQMWRPLPPSIRRQTALLREGPALNRAVTALLRVPVVSRDFARLISGCRLTSTASLPDNHCTENASV